MDILQSLEKYTKAKSVFNVLCLLSQLYTYILLCKYIESNLPNVGKPENPTLHESHKWWFIYWAIISFSSENEIIVQWQLYAFRIL